MEKENTLGNFIEFETKYRVDGDLIYKFKSIVSKLDFKKFVYVEGPDYYYTKPDGSFLRYRKAINEKRAEVTMKAKPEGANSNIKRKEINWRVDHTPAETIEAGAKIQGYDFNFSIYKICHIYNFNDATLVFYTVRDQDNKINHFIEIELDEDSTSELTTEEAMEIIRKYEKILEPLGITYRNRLTKSLFELYVKDIYDNNLTTRTYNE